MSGSFSLTRQGVLLCEGLADQNFFRSLMKDRGLPAFDMLPPNQHFGVTNFGRMLEALKGDALGFSTVLGVLIVADSADDPQRTFSLIQEQVRKVDGYPIPANLNEIAARDGQPGVMITLLPDVDKPGCLESLFVYSQFESEPWVKPIVEDYLGHEALRALSWSAEKRDKALFHSIVAGRCRNDPSRSASSALNRPPVIDIKAACFDSVSERVRRFCDVCNITE